MGIIFHIQASVPRRVRHRAKRAMGKQHIVPVRLPGRVGQRAGTASERRGRGILSQGGRHVHEGVEDKRPRLGRSLP